MRIAFVIPWFGPDLKGGAEQEAWQLAIRLAGRSHDVEVLTTCSRSFLDDWAVSHYRQGTEHMSGVTVRRFHVDARDASSFHALNGLLLSMPRDRFRPGISPVPEPEANVWTRENINSVALEAFLRGNAASYAAVVFIPYLYGPTLRGVHIAGPKAWIQPCLHDEPYAYLPDVAHAFYASKGLLFNSVGEQELTARLYGPAMRAKGHVTGSGIEFFSLQAYARTPLPGKIRGHRFALFLGRRDYTKGVDLLLDAYVRMKQAHPDDGLRLVLAGPGDGRHDSRHPGIIDLGLVTDEVRVALLRECEALVHPSPNESFSRVLYEAWYMGKAAVVRHSCEAMRNAVEACRGGWTAETVADWAARLAALGAGREELASAGARGRAYAREVADWEQVLDRYEAILADGGGRLNLHLPPGLKGVHQLAPNLAYGDAISNEMLEIRDTLRSAGVASDIIVKVAEPAVATEAIPHGTRPLADDEGLIYHHSIGSEVTQTAIAHAGPKALVYHNITPAEYFLPYREDFAKLLRQGREQMWALAPEFAVSAGVSRYNAEELSCFGFESPQVTGLRIEPSSWNQPPTPVLLEKLWDGRPNILFVGRFAPNKRQDRLVQAFALLRSVCDARLVMAGWCPPDDPYSDSVRKLVRDLGIESDVFIPGHGPRADLHAMYRAADLFWSFSEHEGFCVPLIEAMWFEIPVLALAAAAVPETLGDAGMLFGDADDDGEIAIMASQLLADSALRAQIVSRQRLRRERFRRRSTLPALERLMRCMAVETQATARSN